jgi:hypothetical protein
MGRQGILRLVLILVVVCAFAAVDALVKGHHGGTRNAVGDVSAPWALIPFLSSTVALPRRRSTGVLVGAVSTLAALACYSFVRMAAYGEGGPHRGISSAMASATENRWFLLGAIGGAILGAAGSWLASKGQRQIAVAIVTCLLVLEPEARVLWAIAKGEAARTLIPSPTVWAVEILCGCAVALGFRFRTKWQW